MPRPIWSSAALLFAALPAAAQQPSVSPTDPHAAAPPPRYESVFSNYRPYQEPQLAPWQVINDDVGRIGGHVGVMGGAGGHAGHSGGPAAKSSTATTEGGQPPVRGAPKAPAAGAHAH